MLALRPQRARTKLLRSWSVFRPLRSADALCILVVSFLAHTSSQSGLDFTVDAVRDTYVEPWQLVVHAAGRDCVQGAFRRAKSWQCRNPPIRCLQLRGGLRTDAEIDEEIENVISQGEMLDSSVQPSSQQAKEERSKPKPKPKPKRKMASIWREISGQATHVYDFPSMDATPDPYDGWRSDRHIFWVAPNTTLFQEEQMVPFSEQDRFHFREVFDERYNYTVNVSMHSRDAEVSSDGKTAAVRFETGDMITDHIVRHNYDGDLLDITAIETNMSNTNWTPPAGWHIPKDNVDGLEGYSWLPPRTSYVTWSEPRTTGVSRWVLKVDCKEGPMFVGCMLPPHKPKHARATKLKTQAWMLSDAGFACETGPQGKISLSDVVMGQTGTDCWPPYFAAHSLLWLTLDHERGVLQITVNSLPPFALFRIPPGAVPFVALRMPGDGVSLLSVSEAIQNVPSVQRNDVMARWSVRHVEMRSEKPRRRRRAAPTADDTAEEGELEAAEYEFWPGGRLKVSDDPLEEEAAAVAQAEEAEEEVEGMLLTLQQLRHAADDP